MGQDLLGHLYRGRIVGTRVDGTVDMLLKVGWGEEGVTWRYAVCQFCLGSGRGQLTSLANPGPTLVIYESAGTATLLETHHHITPGKHEPKDDETNHRSD